jgi:hypothetical protein
MHGKNVQRLLMESQSKNREPVMMKRKFSINILKNASKNQEIPSFDGAV